jgi:hypothetical protein
MRILNLVILNCILGLSLTVTAGPAASSEAPVLHGPDLIGAPLNSPFVLRIPATGTAPLHFVAKDLPSGLALDENTGILTGTPDTEGSSQVQVTVSNLVNSDTRTWQFVVQHRSVSLTPVMGWNSWYVWGCQVTDQKIRDAARALIDSGLAAHGYNYVNIDDCWQGERDENGEIQTNPNFPDMKDLADYIHSLGLRIGIYTSPGPKTCQKYLGSLDHEAQDIQTYSDWEMDFVKYDWCSFRGDFIAPYKKMGDIIDQAPRAMVYSLCQYGMGDVWTWGKSVKGNMWRTHDDLTDSWESVLANGFGQQGMESYQSPGAFNDPDMLMIGYASWGAPGTEIHKTHLTTDEQRSHISLWSLMSAPLLISSDLTQLDAETMQFLTNDEVLALDQDSLGLQAHKSLDQDGIQIWQKNLSDGSIAVGIFNMEKTEHHFRLDSDSLGVSNSDGYAIRDLWAKNLLGGLSEGYDLKIPSHGVSLLKLTKARK